MTPQQQPTPKPWKRTGSRASCVGAASIASSDADAQLGELSWSRSSLQDELIKSVSGSPVNGSHKQWQDAIMSDERLSLTLEEIVHIRSVLTKAELEVLPVEGRVKEDVEKRRMRIPTEHFAHVPVVLLSPSLLPSPEEEAQSSFPRSLMSRLVAPEHTSMVENSVGSAPSSPTSSRRFASLNAHSAPGSRGGSALGFSDSLSVAPNCMSRSVEAHATPPATLDRRPRYSRSANGVTAVERLRGVQMAVCHDCKAMVLQIIKSSRTSRSASRDRVIRHLTLDLAPVYTADC
ncbi:Protein spire [Operophtera brumata]|uniref:Protein spire n=1 Tax=Operophtera brumata TaxID=104452 RepID=A0A0L7KYV9_OPEBR|nr:Protein spire [Operophtera brumata]